MPSGISDCADWAYGRVVADDGPDIVDDDVWMQKRYRIDVSNNAVLVDQVDPEDM